MRNDYAKLPVAFVENVGQADPSVRYYAQGSRFGFYLTQKEVVLALTKGTSIQASRSRSGSSGAIRTHESKVWIAPPGKVNYLEAPIQRHGTPASRATEQVAYRDLWPGIDWTAMSIGSSPIRVPRAPRRPIVGHPACVRRSRWLFAGRIRRA